MTHASMLLARALALAAGALVPGAVAIGAQPPGVPQDAQALDVPTRVESFLGELGLVDVQAEYLERQVLAMDDPARAEARESLANRLGRLYVQLLADAKTPEERKDLSQRAQRLLELVPQADSFDLRLDMAKAVYLRAETIAERVRLRLDEEDERARAVAMLREQLPIFAQVRSRLSRQVEALEQREARVSEDQLDALRAELGEARRLRSLASFYEGWSRYYLAKLTGQHAEHVGPALEAFGVVLGALPGRAPTLDRLNSSLLRFEHVARAAVGVAMCLSLQGNDTDATRWLEAVLAAPDVPAPVLAQLFSRRLDVLLSAERWGDAESLVRRRRAEEPPAGQPRGLSIAEARLLAVLCLSIDASRLRAGQSSQRDGLLSVALTDLMARRELAQVLDLTRRFGSLPLGADGFVVAYVRGLLLYEDTRAAHRAAGKADQPPTDAALVNAYRQAADLFRAAAASTDAGQFPTQVDRAMLTRGLALYYAGDVLLSAESFERAAQSADAQVREDALWFGIVALDRAADADQASAQSLAVRRERLATVFLSQFPASPNAVRLLISQRRATGLNDAQRLDLLLAVPPDSPMAPAARRVAADLLYARYRGAASTERTVAAQRFLPVAERVLRDDLELVRTSQGEALRTASQHGLLRIRQMLDACLGQSPPDAQQARALLASLTRLPSEVLASNEQIGHELRFRRLQVALAEGDQAAIETLSDEAISGGGPFAGAAARLVYRHFTTSLGDQPANARLARRLVGLGVRAIDSAPTSQGSDALRDEVAGLAAQLWTQEQDVAMRDLAIRIDGQLLSRGLRAVSVLRRHAQLQEAAGNRTAALASWSDLMAGLDASSPEWYEARFESLRLLVVVDPPGAIAALEQYKILHAQPGPQPWHDRILMLGASLPLPPAPAGATKPGGTR